MFKLKSILSYALVSATILCSSPISAGIVNIDFEGLAGTGTSFTAFDSYGQSVNTDGFQFVTDAGLGGFASYNPGPNYTGSIALFANEANANLSLNELGGGEFSIYSIDLAFTDLAQGGGSQELIFTGQRPDTSFVQQSFFIDGILQTYNFNSDFIGIVDLRWSQTRLAGVANNNQFDNLVLNTDAVSVVPVPASIWLFGTAILGLVSITRQKFGVRNLGASALLN